MLFASPRPTSTITRRPALPEASVDTAASTGTFRRRFVSPFALARPPADMGVTHFHGEVLRMGSDQVVQFPRFAIVRRN